uniref:Reverse transcriptase domain-containing protein n=1 Tax=Tanacetum cinerariifolium TaxID=118510 RepID=A0A6L2JV41_TANCI|nr:hypothetical protein [Tanacetum cinerariifolium]
MSKEDPLQNPTQEATENPGDLEVESTPIANEAGGPSNTLLEQDAENPIMQFLIHNFDRMNAMYKSFTQEHTESDNGDPSKSRATTGPMPLTNAVKGRPVVNNDFFHDPFIFKELDRDVRDLVASPFTTRIRDYDIPDGIKVLTNLPERHVPGKLSGATKISKAEILGIRQRQDESLKDYVARFSKETLHMADRSDVMLSGDFIGDMHPESLFKDLIAKPLTSLEDLFTQTNNFIRAEEANNENRLREPRQETKQHMTYKYLPQRNKDKHVSRSANRHTINHRYPCEAFNALIKSPAEILATSEGKSLLRPPPRMFIPASKRDRTKYCEFHEDQDHETNDCIDIRKETEACVRKLTYLDVRVKRHMWRPNIMEQKASLRPKSKIHMIQSAGENSKKAKVSIPNMTFFEDDSILEHCTSNDPLIITADVGTTQIHRIYVDRGSSTEIMYEHYFEQLSGEEKREIRPPATPLVGFFGRVSWPLGLITLPITLYDYRVHISKTVMRAMTKEKSEEITTEVSKLVEARILKAVFFPKFVSNPVMVKKADGTWRMCIDFTSLNKACPKDSYPLPKMDQKIESLEGFKLKCF